MALPTGGIAARIQAVFSRIHYPKQTLISDREFLYNHWFSFARRATVAYNSFLDQFLMFYSQADAGNGLTRSLEDPLARRTYVPTTGSSPPTPSA